MGYKRLIGVLRCLLSIPYAPIPAASGFGAGFGCLNTFSKGIWSTRVFCFFLRNQKVAASLQDTTYNDEQWDANKSWFENVVYRKNALMGTGKTTEKKVPTLWSLSKYNCPALWISEISYPNILNTDRKYTKGLSRRYNQFTKTRLCSPPNSWQDQHGTETLPTKLFQPPRFHRSSFPLSEHWRKHPADLAAEVLYQSGVARQCRNEVKETFASNRSPPIRRDGWMFSTWQRKVLGRLLEKCCGTLELPGESNCLCEQFYQIIHTSRMDSDQSSRLSDSSGSFTSSTTTWCVPSHWPEFHDTPNLEWRSKPSIKVVRVHHFHPHHLPTPNACSAYNAQTQISLCHVQWQQTIQSCTSRRTNPISMPRNFQRFSAQKVRCFEIRKKIR